MLRSLLAVGVSLKADFCSLLLGLCKRSGIAVELARVVPNKALSDIELLHTDCAAGNACLLYLHARQ